MFRFKLTVNNLPPKIDAFNYIYLQQLQAVKDQVGLQVIRAYPLSLFKDGNRILLDTLKSFCRID